jgi:hypothetical protein
VAECGRWILAGNILIKVDPSRGHRIENAPLTEYHIRSRGEIRWRDKHFIASIMFLGKYPPPRLEISLAAMISQVK